MSSWTLLDEARNGHLTTGTDANPWRTAWVHREDGEAVEASATITVALWDSGLLFLGKPDPSVAGARRWTLTAPGLRAWDFMQQRGQLLPGQDVPPVGGPYS